MTIVQLALAFLAFATIVVLVAMIAAFVLQFIYSFLRLRGYLQRWFVRHWLRQRSRIAPKLQPSDAPSGLPSRTTPTRSSEQEALAAVVDAVESTLVRLWGRRTSAYAYDLPYPQLCAQVSNATRAAMEVLTTPRSGAKATAATKGSATAASAHRAPRAPMPREFRALGRARLREFVSVFAATADSRDLRRLGKGAVAWSERGSAEVSPSGLEPKVPARLDEEAERRRIESASRVLYHIERGIDSLQSALRAWWNQTTYVLAFIISASLLIAVQQEVVRGDWRLPMVGATAPVIPLTLLVSVMAALVTPYTSRMIERFGREV